MLCTVQKEFQTVGGKKLQRGARVDSDQFRLGRQLIAQRYLLPLPAVQHTSDTELVDTEPKTKKRKNA